MSLFKLSTGQLANGNPDDAFVPEITIIPNNTKALAAVDKLEYRQYQGEWYYQATWKLLNAPYANRTVTQKFHVEHELTNKSDRAKEMFMLLHKLCNIKINENQDQLTEQDLMQFKGKVCGILIREWQINDKEGNFVAEVHPTVGFTEEQGIKMLPKKYKTEQSGFGGHSGSLDDRNPPPIDNEDIPF